MIPDRKTAIRKLLGELTIDFIDNQQYFEDLEPQGVYDTALRGKLLALVSYLKLIGRDDLSTSVEEFLPLHGNAVEALTFINDHVTPEVMSFLDLGALDGVEKKGRRFCYTDHVLGQGERFFEEIERIGLEGMVAKKVKSVYVSGRSRDWLKIKTEVGRSEMIRRWNGGMGECCGLCFSGGSEPFGVAVIKLGRGPSPAAASKINVSLFLEYLEGTFLSALLGALPQKSDY